MNELATYVSYSTATANWVNTITVNKPAGVLSGDLLIAYISKTMYGVGDLAPSGWTLIRTDSNSSCCRSGIYYKVATSSEPASYTWNIAGSETYGIGTIQVYRGADTTSPINAHGATTPISGTSYQAPSITTTVADTRLVTFFVARNGTATWTPPTGMTEAYDFRFSTGTLTTSSANASMAAAGATGTKTATLSSSAWGIAQIIAIAPPAPTPTPTPTPTSTPGASPTGTPAAATAQGVQKMRLVSPKDNTVAGTRVTFTCTAEGEGLKEIALYTDISGSWKKDEKKLVTDSPATVQFRKENVPEGKYNWNCEATTSAGSVFLADDDRTFEVKLATSPLPDVVCSQTDDCGSRAPTTCPESELQTRTCSKYEECGYSLTRTCTPAQLGKEKQTAAPDSVASTDTEKAESELDLTLIAISAGLTFSVIVAIVLVTRRRKGAED